MTADSGMLLMASFGMALLIFTLLWIAAFKRRDAGFVDIGWTAGVGLTALLFAAASDGWAGRRVVVSLLASFWAFRLAAYIFADRILAQEEDGRYRRLRDHWGRRADFKFFFFFTGQSFLVVLFALPFLPLMRYAGSGFRVWDILGILLWTVSVAGEAMADGQLARFRADPVNRGRTCRQGLWRYSRHPNYFFEWLHWWSYVVMAVGVPGGWMTLVGPAAMLLFLFKLTGIPYTERQAVASRGDDYRDYQRTTSVFLPLPPREVGT